MGTAYFESGGIALSRAVRAAYIENPKRCLRCDAAIMPRDGKGGVAAARRQKFCSKACAAIFNNHLPKRTRKRIPCKRCGDDLNVAPVGSSRSLRTYCSSCWKARSDEMGARTKGESTHSIIRQYSRLAIAHQPKRCRVCGYEKHVEACHRRPVASFPADATLREMNAPTNLLWLCPNHHWEMDNNALSDAETALLDSSCE